MMQMGRAVEPASVLGSPENAAYYSAGRHPGVVSALAWLAFSHLPDPLKDASRPFYEAAVQLVRTIETDSAELTTALNRLVEAKDWAVRAQVRQVTGQPGPMARPSQIVDPPVGNYGPGQSRPATDPGDLPRRPIKDNPQA